VKRLVDDGHEVRSTDVKRLGDWWQRGGETWPQLDLRFHAPTSALLDGVEVVYHLGASIGGMGYLSDHANDRETMFGNCEIDVNVYRAAVDAGVKRLVYASSACVYPEHLQLTTTAQALREGDAYPAAPDLEYGWQKLFSERMLAALESETFKPLAVRFHNVAGPFGSWTGGREKAPAALCRKVAEAKLRGEKSIEIWGDGAQRRSFLWVGDCVEGLIRLAATDITDPINLGSDLSVSIDELAAIVANVAGYPDLDLVHVPGPMGVRARNADLTRLRAVLGWTPPTPLEDWLRTTYEWIESKVYWGEGR
jgi:nucleoside-diphosphate-sugar epimerase